jgi:hypothetical protein
MKISLKLANGALLEFEGDAAEFERVSAFLEQPPDSLTATPPPEATVIRPAHTRPTPNATAPDDLEDSGPYVEPAAAMERLEQVGADNDQERVTVMAQLATEAGHEGVNYETINHLYTELGFRKPAQFPAKTFSNAKASGLVRSVKPGIWKPTYRGENFARGLGRGPERPARRTGSRQRSSSNQGGESD